MMARLMTLFIGMIVGTVLVGTTILVATNVSAQNPDAPLAISQVLSYQGRLLTPSTGEPKPDSVYQITFSLYNVASGGTSLWAETKSVTTSNGFFTTLLGDTTALILNNFNGQELFLGIKVGDDPEATPRQRLAHTAYAMWAEKAGVADTATTATNATNATNAANATTAGNAGTLDNLDSTAFAAASHNHDGGAINAGTVAEARIDGALARDNEVKGIMLANDGAGSALDADLLDGQSSAAFAAASHTHSSFTIANGFINSDGTKVVGTSNVSSVWEGNPLNRYRITISGEAYFYPNYVTVVTPASTTGCQTVTTSVGSVSNALLVYIFNDAGAAVQCPFQFVTFKP